MDIALCASILRIRNRRLCEALKEGLKKHGDTLIHYNSPEVQCSPKEDVRLIIGNLDTKQCIDGIHRFVFDKGYDRGRKNIDEWIHWSIRYMPDWPETRLMFNAPQDRTNTLRMELRPRKKEGTVITVATSSQKYYTHHHLGNATEYSANIIAEVKKITKRKIWYRPKPSWHGAVPIKGTYFHRARGPDAMKALFNKTFLLITDGSHIGSRSIIEGVPAISLEGGMAYSVTGHSLDNLEDPYWPNEQKRKNWFADIGYSQYTIPEIESGLAWEIMKQKLQ